MTYGPPAGTGSPEAVGRAAPAGRLPQLFSRRCDTCIFRPGNPMRLVEGRLADLIAANQSEGTLLICHKTTYGQHPELGETMCRGYFDAYAAESAVAQIMERLAGSDWFTQVDPPTTPDIPPSS